jgi:hypothetical protein
MANLKSLAIRFKSPLSRPLRGSRRPTPPTRTVLPALTRFRFDGASEYLEDLVARIDAPLLDSINMTFFHQLIFDIPQPARFMSRSTRFHEFKEARLCFYDRSVYVDSLPPTPTPGKTHRLGISCRNLGWQLSSIAQVLTSLFPSIYVVEHLYICLQVSGVTNTMAN